MIYRIEVSTRPTGQAPDPFGQAVAHQIAAFGYTIGAVRAYRVYLIDTDAAQTEIARVTQDLLADPIVETAEVVQSPRAGDLSNSRIEIHLKPGVMDPVAASAEAAIRDMGIAIRQMRTGRAFVIEGRIDQAQLAEMASRVLANGVIESVHFDRYLPERFPALNDEPLKLRRVALRELSEDQLARLSRDGHLFLSPVEMKAVQAHYRALDREPTDIELETLAQTWSEHCVHKTLKSAVELEVRDAAGKTIETRRYRNLIKETIFGSTQKLMADEKASDPFCLSVFADNAGVIAFDHTDAMCFKVETHNHPSAIEPYGGSATGAGGVIRDVLGTGLAAKPVANTDVFCVALPDADRILPRGVIHPRRVLQQVVAGVRDYGNRMGIPTVNGAVYFDDHYLGNPLVFCGCVGIIPRDKIKKAALSGDAIVVMGGRTGRDGIHGATFSSAELTDTHADEFSHAVQIGNAITEKKVADVILAARDSGLFTAVTDCGAGGLSSAVGEMAEHLGAMVQLDRVPLKYAGLRYDEIWISEAQERMVLSVPQKHVAALLALSASEDVESTVIGSFGTPGAELILRFGDSEVGRLSMAFLHNGLPMPTRKAVVIQNDPARAGAATDANAGRNSISPGQFRENLLKLLAHPNIASKHWVIRQYDHEVQGGSVIKPLIGPMQIGPSDAAVIRPKLGSYRGVALACGMAPAIEDPYDMALASIDEAIRNAVAVGAHPDRIAILDNFCWPSVDDEITMGTLVRACEACRDAALAYRIPFISGKDSLHNQFTNQETGQVLRIPRTLLISAIGIISDIRRCVTMDFKQAGSAVMLISCEKPRSPAALAAMHRALADLIGRGAVSACHDVSDGGIAVALAEMCIASGIGIHVGAELMLSPEGFAERPGQYLIELSPDNAAAANLKPLQAAARVIQIATTQELAAFALSQEAKPAIEIDIADLTAAWRGTLDW